LKKILIIRFSSIGDIVLTTPIIRCLKQQLPNCEIHYLTKIQYKPILDENPYIDRIFCVRQKIDEVIDELKTENFDFIVDLHKNFRSLGVRKKLGVKAASFPKLNIKKWLLVHFKINRLPNIHIVDRYFVAVKSLGANNDLQGLDYFIPDYDQVKLETLPYEFSGGYIGFVIGGQHKTKQLPIEKSVEILKKINKPVVILGGPEDYVQAEDIIRKVDGDLFNACGKYNINQSASLVRQADVIITGDTGLMHIAAAFRKKIISVWGNTVPEFGMYPYMPGDKDLSKIFEIKDLSCRPCSKIGYDKCPKGHFDCMNKLDAVSVASAVNER